MRCAREKTALAVRVKHSYRDGIQFTRFQRLLGNDIAMEILASVRVLRWESTADTDFGSVDEAFTNTADAFDVKIRSAPPFPILRDQDVTAIPDVAFLPFQSRITIPGTGNRRDGPVLRHGWLWTISRCERLIRWRNIQSGGPMETIQQESFEEG